MGIRVDLKIPLQSQNENSFDSAVHFQVASNLKKAVDYYSGPEFSGRDFPAADHASWWNFLPLLGLFARRTDMSMAEAEMNRMLLSCFRKMNAAKNVPDKVLYATTAISLHVQLAASEMMGLSAGDQDGEFNKKINRMVVLLARANDAAQIAADMLKPLLKRYGPTDNRAFDIYSIALDTKVRILMFFSNVTGDRFAFEGAVDTARELIQHLLRSENPDDLRLARLYFTRLRAYLGYDFIHEHGKIIDLNSKKFNAAGVFSPSIKTWPTLHPLVPKIGMSRHHSILLELKMTIYNDFSRSAVELRNLIFGLDEVNTRLLKRYEKR